MTQEKMKSDIKSVENFKKGVVVSNNKYHSNIKYDKE